MANKEFPKISDKTKHDNMVDWLIERVVFAIVQGGLTHLDLVNACTKAESQVRESGIFKEQADIINDTGA